MSKVKDILQSVFSNYSDETTWAIEKDLIEAEHQLNAYIAEVIGVDEPEQYGQGDIQPTYRNVLRVEQRERAGL